MRTLWAKYRNATLVFCWKKNYLFTTCQREQPTSATAPDVTDFKDFTLDYRSIPGDRYTAVRVLFFFFFSFNLCMCFFGSLGIAKTLFSLLAGKTLNPQWYRKNSHHSLSKKQSTKGFQSTVTNWNWERISHRWDCHVYINFFIYMFVFRHYSHDFNSWQSESTLPVRWS